MLAKWQMLIDPNAIYSRSPNDAMCAHCHGWCPTGPNGSLWPLWQGGLGQQPPLALVATMGAANTTVGTGWPQYLPLEVP